MISSRDIETRLRSLAPLQPSPELRRRLFAQIRLESPTRVHFLDRLWFSRGMRFAAVSLLVLAIAISMSDSSHFNQQLAAITGPAVEESWLLDIDPALELELGITGYEIARWRLASRPSQLERITTQNELATLLELWDV